MTTTTKVISLTLMGGTLAFIGWQCLQHPGAGGHGRVGHRSHFPIFFHSWGGGGGASHGPAVGGSSRGGFGATGHGVGGGA